MLKCLLTALLLCVPLTAFGAEKPPTVVFEETFVEKLDKEWSWVREEPKAWSLRDKSLVLRTLPGYLHANYNNSANILLRPLPDLKNVPVAVEVLVESDPQAQYEHAGPVWYYDDDNYAAIFQEALGGKRKLQMVTEKAGKPELTASACPAKTLWLRIEVAEDTLTTLFREPEKDEWTVVGRNKLPASKLTPRIGVMAGGAPKDGTRVAKFENFRVVSLAK